MFKWGLAIELQQERENGNFSQGKSREIRPRMRQMRHGDDQQSSERQKASGPGLSKSGLETAVMESTGKKTQGTILSQHRIPERDPDLMLVGDKQADQ